MAEQVTRAQTSLGSEDVIVRAVQFFTSEKWRPQSQSARIATFQGKPPIPWGLLILTIIGLFMLFIPGIIMYVLVVRRAMRFQNLVVTVNPTKAGSEVVVTYPNHAKNLVQRYSDLLPKT